MSCRGGRGDSQLLQPRLPTLEGVQSRSKLLRLVDCSAGKMVRGEKSSHSGRTGSCCTILKRVIRSVDGGAMVGEFVHHAESQMFSSSSRVFHGRLRSTVLSDVTKRAA